MEASGVAQGLQGIAAGVTSQIRQAAERSAEEQARPLIYLRNSQMDKDAWARQLAQRDGIHQGLIGVLKSVENCWSYTVGPN